MKYQAFKMARSALGLVAIALTIGAVAVVGSAAAATQHWASGPEAPFGISQLFTGKANGSSEMKVPFGGGDVAINCTSMSISGTAENPAAGGAATLRGVSFALGGCTTNVAGCVLEGGSIPFEALKGSTREESGEDRVRFEPAANNTIAVLHFKAACSLGSSWTLSGFFEATEDVGKPGFYEISYSGLKLGKAEFKMSGGLTLSASSTQALALASEGAPAKPRWLLVSTVWAAVPTGVSTSIINTSAFPFSLSVTIGGSPVNITCGGNGNFVAGSIENPAAGGAGTASTLFTFGSCEVSVKGCLIENAASAGHLPGVAAEIGAIPAVEWASGRELFVFHLNAACSIGDSITVMGRLIATSAGNGYFNLSHSELKVGKQKATVSANFGLETGATAEPLRLQP
jgi:hypothetical protein